MSHNMSESNINYFAMQSDPDPEVFTLRDKVSDLTSRLVTACEYIEYRGGFSHPFNLSLQPVESWWRDHKAEIARLQAETREERRAAFFASLTDEQKSFLGMER
jgi:hypothetical protein